MSHHRSGGLQSTENFPQEQSVDFARQVALLFELQAKLRRRVRLTVDSQVRGHLETPEPLKLHQKPFADAREVVFVGRRRLFQHHFQLFLRKHRLFSQNCGGWAKNGNVNASERELRRNKAKSLSFWNTSNRHGYCSSPSLWKVRKERLRVFFPAPKKHSTNTLERSFRPSKRSSTSFCSFTSCFGFTARRKKAFSSHRTKTVLRRNFWRLKK